MGGLRGTIGTMPGGVAGGGYMPVPTVGGGRQAPQPVPGGWFPTVTGGRGGRMRRMGRMAGRAAGPAALVGLGAAGLMGGGEADPVAKAGESFGESLKFVGGKAATGAGWGAMLGPWGALAGGALGVGKAVFDAATYKPPEPEYTGTGVSWEEYAKNNPAMAALAKAQNTGKQATAAELEAVRANLGAVATGAGPVTNNYITVAPNAVNVNGAKDPQQVAVQVFEEQLPRHYRERAERQ